MLASCAARANAERAKREQEQAKRAKVAAELAAIRKRTDLGPVVPKPPTRQARIAAALDKLAEDREALDRALWPDPPQRSRCGSASSPPFESSWPGIPSGS